MSETDWGRAKAIFGEAMDLPSEGRGPYLDAACGDDAALRARVQGLLNAERDAGAFMSAPSVGGPAPDASEPGDLRTQSVGDRIGPYTLLELIGEGGFGVVYAAEQTEPLRRQVALKVIKLGMDTRQVIARFDQERQALAMMEHPNIARVFDAGATAQGRPYFVMELIRGVPITRYCDEARLTPRQRLELFIPVCQAVQHAHQKGIIHRDLKPGNVLVMLQDGGPVPKIIDFGIAKATSRHVAEKTVFTELQQIVGTPEYMSPEQAEMTGLDVDTRSDVYSLGVLLYELLTGATPFDAGELRSAAFSEMQRIIREVDPPRPSTRLSTLRGLPDVAANRRTEPKRLGALVRGDLDWIVMRCLEKDRSRRYETAIGLAADVQRHLAGEPVLAAPPGAWYRTAKLVRRHKTAVLASGLVVMALLLGMAGTTIGLLRARAATRAEFLQRREAQTTAEFLQDLLKGIEPVWALGRDTTLLRELTGASVARIEAGELKGTPEVEVRLRRTIGAAYTACSQLDIADRMLSAALALAQRTWPRGHEQVAACQNDLGELRLYQGRFAEGNELLAEALRARRQLFPGDSREVAESINNLAFCRPRDAALPMFIAALDMRQRVFAGNHAEVAEGLSNVGYAYANLGRYEPSLSYHERAIAMRRAMYGNLHPDVAASLSNMASSLAWLGRTEEALPKMQEALSIYQHLCSENHHLVATAMTGVGKCLEAVGRAEEGLPLCEHALDIRRHAGVGAQDIAEALDNAGDCLCSLGKWEEARQRYSESLSLKLGLDPPDPAQVGLAHGNLGRALVGLNRPAEALPEFDKAVAALGNGDGPHAMWAGSAYADRARCRIRLGQVEAALSDDQQSLHIRRAVYGADDHPAVAASLEHIGMDQEALGRAADAAGSFQECLDMRERLVRKGRERAWRRFHTMSLLGGALAAQRRFTQAESMLLTAADGLRDDPSLLSPGAAGGADPRRQAYERMRSMYDAWERAEPAKGYGAKAGQWQARLDALAPPPEPK